MAEIKKISGDKIKSLQRKSAYSLPNNPIDSGYKPDDIKNALWKPMLNEEDSLLAEVNRVVEETNERFTENYGYLNPQKYLNFVLSEDGTSYSVLKSDLLTKDIVGNLIIPSEKPIVSIETYGFSGCSGLISIEIPNGVKYINISAFYGCSSLTSIKIPASVTSIGQIAFKNCSNLRSITMLSKTPPSAAWEIFEGTASNLKITVPYGCGEAYKTAKYWNDYSDKIVEEESVASATYDSKGRNIADTFDKTNKEFEKISGELEKAIINRMEAIPDGSDLNNYINAGLYQWQAGKYEPSQESWIYNAPTQDGFGIFKVEVTNEYILQTLYLENSDIVYRRTGYIGYGARDWKEWNKYVSEKTFNEIINGIVGDKLSTVYKYVGSVTTYEELMTMLPEHLKVGDVFNVSEAHENYPAGTNYAWNGEEWDALGGSVDLTPITEALDNKVSKIKNPTYPQVYVADTNGQVSRTLSDYHTAWTVPLRYTDGRVKVGTPVDNNDATTKKYVDGAITTVTEIAEGKANIYVTSIVETGMQELNSQEDVISIEREIQAIENGSYKSISLSDLKLGDIIYIIETTVPDRWVSHYNSGDDGSVIRVYLSKMETAKVDLEPYALKESVETKLDKITGNTNTRVYAVYPNGQQISFQSSQNAIADSIPQRYTGGRLRVGEAAEGSDAVNISWLSSGKAKSIYNSRIRGGWIDTHAEENPTIISYFMNDLACLFDKGGSCAVTGTTVNSSTLRTWFDGTPSYGNFTVDAVTDTVVILVKSPQTYTFNSRFGIGFGSANWRAKDVKIEVGYAETIGGDPTDDMWKTMLEVTGSSLPIQTTGGFGPGTNGAWNAIRITLTNFNTTTPRIADIWSMNYGSQSLATTLLPRKGGTIYGNLEVTGTTTVKKPTADNHAATKGYVDEKIAAIPAVGSTVANVKRIEFDRTFWAGETNPTFSALFWATEVTDGDITVIGTTGGTAYNTENGLTNVANIYLDQENYDALYDETQPENGLFEFGDVFGFPFLDIMNIKTFEDDTTNYRYSQVEVPSTTEIYSSDKNIKAAFAFTESYGSPGMIYDAQITVKEFTYIRIVLELIATDVYAATILTDGVIEEVDYNE